MDKGSRSPPSRAASNRNWPGDWLWNHASALSLSESLISSEQPISMPWVWDCPFSNLPRPFRSSSWVRPGSPCILAICWLLTRGFHQSEADFPASLSPTTFDLGTKRTASCKTWWRPVGASSSRLSLQSGAGIRDILQIRTDSFGRWHGTHVSLTSSRSRRVGLLAVPEPWQRA
jgi:hypothetical protein